MVYNRQYTPWYTIDNIHHGIQSTIYTMVYNKQYTPWYTINNIHHGI